jgi:hypothetical protein
MEFPSSSVLKGLMFTSCNPKVTYIILWVAPLFIILQRICIVMQKYISQGATRSPGEKLNVHKRSQKYNAASYPYLWVDGWSLRNTPSKSHIIRWVWVGKTDGAAGKWNTFFRAVEARKDDALLKQLWGQAESAGTQYGSDLAESMGYSAPHWSSDFSGKLFLEIGDIYRSVAGLPYGGEIVGAGFVGFPIGYAGFRACGPLCAVGGVLVGGIGGGYLGGRATDPGSDINGHHMVYYVADAILGRK